MAGELTFIDRGGTFTDVVVVREGHVSFRKVPSDLAVMGELAQGSLTFGTTVATNALLERTLAPTLLVVSEGFADLAALGDMSRAGLFQPDLPGPPPLWVRVVEVAGRIDAHGREIEPLSLPELPLDGIGSVAVVLLNSGRNGAHERAVAAILPTHLDVSLGYQVAPGVGYLARIESTLLDAAVTPVLHAALRRDAIPLSARAICSDGGLVSAPALRGPDAVLSGPAGGVLAVHAIAEDLGLPSAVGLDMGGTSTDVCLVEVGALPRRTGTWQAGGARVARPALEVDTIAAGGGSVLGRDDIGYSVGPASAGADPGPQAYGRGGPPTVTDAALAAGLFRPEGFPIPLHPEAVKLPGPPEAFLDLVRDKMAAAVRGLALRRGVDLTEAGLVAFGGAAGQHACAVAARLGIRTVVVHVCAPVLSAWGLALARQEAEQRIPIWAPLSRAWPAVEAAWARLEASLPALGEAERWVELRVVGTDAALRASGTSPTAVAASFAQSWSRRFGRSLGDAELEVVDAGVRARGPIPPRLPALTWPPGVPERARGPMQVALEGTTLVVEAGWELSREGENLVLRAGPGVAGRPMGGDLALWAQRFSTVAEESGEVLRRLARSVNIRERLDFSCAVFNGEGTLVANAPHVPVHLGAMGETVRDLCRAHPDAPDGTSWLSNDPAAGGSHLPDLTVVRCVRLGGQRFYVANRAHHVDVGGTTPGSMPPNSRTLAEEGVCFSRWPLWVDGQLRLPPLDGLRDPDSVAADLRAQLVANAHAARALAALGPPERLATEMAALVDAVALAVAKLLVGLHGEASDDLDGVPLRLRVYDGCFDFSGTGGPHPGNLNAPLGVVRAAVLYALRVLVNHDLPLNEGVLRAVQLRVPPGSILDPPAGRAVVGGNVETSQRLVDLIFRAVGARAASQGTMNNLSFGGARWAFYETLGGGLGASPAGAGRGGGQVHMTNTRATDPEVLEARLPLRVRRFALRCGSGGAGAYAGGEGLVRELELTEPAQAALLAAWRPAGAAGLAGGEAGAPGHAEVWREGRWEPWNGQAMGLSAGDRVRVSTPGGGGWGVAHRR